MKQESNQNFWRFWRFRKGGRAASYLARKGPTATMLHACLPACLPACETPHPLISKRRPLHRL